MRRLPLLIIVLLVFFPASVQSRTWYIKVDGTGDAPTIQAGIDSAAASDTVLVASGTYTWTNQGTSGFWLILIMDKEVCLLGENGPEATVLDAEGEGRVIGVGSHGTSIIEGFTITGGWADEMTGGGYGAGMFLSYADPRIASNIVTGNIAMGSGGAMYCGYSEATITGNSIAGNTALNDAGGIYCDHSDVVITGNTFAGNLAEIAGGVFCKNSNPTISGNVFTGNDVGHGGVVTCSGSSPTVMNNTIVGNSMTQGGAIESVLSSSPVISNNIVTGSLGGSALYCDGSGSPTVTCNDFWSNAGGDGNCTLGADNFSADPMFCDEESEDFSLHEDSPCAPGNSPSGCGLVGALPVGCWSTPVSGRALAVLAASLLAVVLWAIRRRRCQAQ